MREKGDALSFDFDGDPATLDRARRIYDATSVDLRAFKARGGKMLMWHGWAAGAIMATCSIGYYGEIFAIASKGGVIGIWPNGDSIPTYG